MRTNDASDPLFHDASILVSVGVFLMHQIETVGVFARLAKRREILIFPRTAGNTGNSRELLGNKSLSNQKVLNYNIITGIIIYVRQKINKQPFIQSLNKYRDKISSSCAFAVKLLSYMTWSKDESVCTVVSQLLKDTEISSTYCHLSVE